MVEASLYAGCRNAGRWIRKGPRGRGSCEPTLAAKTNTPRGWRPGALMGHLRRFRRAVKEFEPGGEKAPAVAQKGHR
jgi:hypothetical protein